MDIMFGLEFERVRSSAEWHEILVPLLESLDSQDLIPGHLSLEDDGGKRVRLKSVRELIDSASRWARGMHVVSNRKRTYDLSVSLRPERMGFYLALSEENDARRRQSLLNLSTRGLRLLLREQLQNFAVEYGSELSARNFSYPRPRPPRNFPLCGKSSLVDVLDRRCESRRGHGDLLETIRRAELPEQAQRDEFQDLCVLQWVSETDIVDDERVRSCLSRREQWLADTLEAPIAKDWNADGDFASDPVAAAPHPPLTLFSPPLGVGYKAVHTAMGEEAIESELRRVGEWIQAGQLEDGTSFSDVILIVESRAAAIALQTQAAAAGVPHIFYTGEDGRLWDPFPEGEWTS
jgi:hypothetical protein